MDGSRPGPPGHNPHDSLPRPESRTSQVDQTPNWGFYHHPAEDPLIKFHNFNAQQPPTPHESNNHRLPIHQPPRIPSSHMQQPHSISLQNRINRRGLDQSNQSSQNQSNDQLHQNLHQMQFVRLNTHIPQARQSSSLYVQKQQAAAIVENLMEQIPQNSQLLRQQEVVGAQEIDVDRPPPPYAPQMQSQSSSSSLILKDESPDAPTGRESNGHCENESNPGDLVKEEHVWHDHSITSELKNTTEKLHEPPGQKDQQQQSRGFVKPQNHLKDRTNQRNDTNSLRITPSSIDLRVISPFTKSSNNQSSKDPKINSHDTAFEGKKASEDCRGQDSSRNNSGRHRPRLKERKSRSKEERSKSRSRSRTGIRPEDRPPSWTQQNSDQRREERPQSINGTHAKERSREERKRSQDSRNVTAVGSSAKHPRIDENRDHAHQRSKNAAANGSSGQKISVQQYVDRTRGRNEADSTTKSHEEVVAESSRQAIEQRLVPKTVLRKSNEELWAVVSQAESNNSNQNSTRDSDAESCDSTTSSEGKENAMNVEELESRVPLKINSGLVFVLKAVRDDLKSKHPTILVTRPSTHRLISSTRSGEIQQVSDATLRNPDGSRNYYEDQGPPRDGMGMYIDPVRSFQSLLILCKRESTSRPKLRAIEPPVTLAQNVFNYAFCFKQACGRVDHHTYVFRHLMSDKFPDLKINYRSLFNDSLEIRNLYEIFSSLKRTIRDVGKFIIYTNRKLSASTFESKGIRVLQPSGVNSWKIVVDEGSKLYQRIVENTPLYKLAGILDGSLRKKALLTSELRTYHLALIEDKIIELLTDQTCKSGRIGIFHKDFVYNRNLSEDAAELRKYLLNHMKDKQLSRDMRLNLPERFGKRYVYDEDPRVTNIEELVKILIRYSRDSLDQIDQPPILIRKDSKVKEDIEKIVDHVLSADKQKVIKFTRTFLDLHANLRGNLGDVRRLFKEQLSRIDIQWTALNHCKFRMYDYCDDDSLEGFKTTLEGEGIGKKVKEFFEVMEFQFHDPNVQKVLCREVHANFGELENPDIFEVVRESFLGLLKSQEIDSNSLLESLRRVISTKKMLGCKMNIGPEVDFIKDCETLFHLERLFSNSDSDCREFTIASDCTFITILMIKYLIERKLDARQAGPRHIILKLEELQDVERYMDDVLRSTIYIIIDCGGNSITKDQIRSTLRNLHNRLLPLPASIAKRLILVAPTNKLPAQLEAKPGYHRCEVKGIKEMQKDSRKKLLREVQIKMRERFVTLQDLMNEQMAQDFLLRPEILNHYMANSLEINDLVSPSLRYNEIDQMSSSIKRTVVISPKVLTSENRDIFMIKNIGRSQLQQLTPKGSKIYDLNAISPMMRCDVRYVLFPDDRTPEFNNIAQDYERNVHLITYNGMDEFVWELSNGSIKSLTPHRLHSVRESFAKDGICDIPAHVQDDNKVVIICGETGTGKSSYLQRLIKLSADFNSRMWSIQISLNPEYFAGYEERSILDPKTAVNYVMVRLKCDDFYKRLFHLSAYYGSNLKIALMIDGYGELPFALTKLARQLIENLLKTHVSKVYITVTPGRSRKDLEYYLCAFSYDMYEFSETERINFLIRYWTRNSEAQASEDQLLQLAEDLISHFDGFDPPLTSKPLHLEMLADLHTDFDDEEPEIISEIHNAFDLYEYYVQKHLTRSSYSAVIRKSLKRLFSISKLKELGIIGELEMMSQSDQDNDNFPPELDHVTFSEYIVADWLRKKYLSEEYDQDKVLKCIDAIVYTTSSVFFDGVKKIFDLDSNFQSFIHCLARQEYSNFLQVLLRYDDREWSSMSGKTPLHSAVHSKSLKAVKCLLEHKCPGYETLFHHGGLNSKNANSSFAKLVDTATDGKRAVDIAADGGDVEIACELALAGADLSSLKKDFLSEMSNFVTRELSKIEPLKDHRLRPLAEKLFLLAPYMGFTRVERKTLYPRILPYFLAHGRVKVVECLMRALPMIETYEILQTKCCNETPLDIVNSSKILTDDERLAITEYLFRTMDQNLAKKCVRSILQACITFEHSRTFKYFISSDEGFCKYSVETNNFKNIEFLIRHQDNENIVLHKAVGLDISLKTLKFIVDRSDINRQNYHGETPLTIAIMKRARLQVIKYLVDRGAHLNREDRRGLYPWCYVLLDKTGYSKDETDILMKYFLTEVKSEIEMPPEKKVDLTHDRQRKEVMLKLEYYKNCDTSLNENEVLHTAIKSKHLENWAKFLIMHDADVTLKDGLKKQPLHLAVEYRRHDLIKLLLEHKAEFDQPDGDCETPVQLARQLLERSPEDEDMIESCKLLSTAEKYFAAEELPKKGTKFEQLWNCRNHKKQSLLHVAADTYSDKALKYLIDHHKTAYKDDYSFYLSDRDANGDTPIHVAARKGYYDVVAKLIYNGANYGMQNYAGMTPLKLAKEGRFAKIVELLNTVENLFSLVKSGDSEKIDQVMHLVKKNPDIVNARIGVDGKTVLHWAIISASSTKLLEKLINLNYYHHIYAYDIEKRTPLHYAVEKDHLDCVKMLIRAGALIDAKDKYGSRPFDLGNRDNRSRQMLQNINRFFEDIQCEDPEFVNENPVKFSKHLSDMCSNYRIEPHVVVNSRDSEKRSLLHYAVKYHFPEIVICLLKNGAIYNRPDRNKIEPSHSAVCCEDLLRNIDKLFDCLKVETWLSLAVDEQILLNCRSFCGGTLLHKVAKRGQIEEVKWLLKKGADKNACDLRGLTPIHSAKNQKIIDLLKDTN